MRVEAVTLIDAVLAVFAVELLVFAAIGRRAGRRIRMTALLPNLGAGLSLLLAVRSQAQGGGVLLLGCLLALAGACHVVDLMVRLRRDT